MQLTEYSVSHCFYWIFLDLKISVISVILHVGIYYVYISMDVVKNIKRNQKILKNHEEFHKSMEIMKNIQKSWKISKNHEKFQNLYSEYCIRYHLYFTEYYWILGILPRIIDLLNITEYYCIFKSTDNHCIISKFHWILQPRFWMVKAGSPAVIDALTLDCRSSADRNGWLSTVRPALITTRGIWGVTRGMQYLFEWNVL